MPSYTAPDLDHILDDVIRFTPPDGSEAEWPPVPEWTDNDWRHWLRQHNKYPFLRQWDESAIERYIQHDRYYYGLGLKRHPNDPPTWFYNPTPVAVPFHASKVANILFGGAAGGSKSHSARHDAYRHCFAIPEFRAILMRRTFEELKRNHLDRARSECEKINAFYDKEVMQLVTTEHELRIDCHGRGRESKIIFGHCQNLGDEEKYLGDAYDAFYPDEMATFLKKQIVGIQGRVRTEKYYQGRRLLARMPGTSNPGGANTLWLKDYFIDHLTDEIRRDNPRYKPERYQFIPAMLYDNPYYMDPDGTYTEYEDRLFEYDPERRRQLLLGDWSALGGQFFPEFNANRHVATISIPAGCKIERWIDWGYDPHYGVCLWVAHLPDGRLYVFYEWRFNGANAREKLVAAQVAKRIKEYTFNDVLPLARTKRVNRSIADPSMFAADGHTGEDYATTFTRYGVPLQQADNERVMGWGRLRHWFRLAPDGKPWILFHPRCVTCIRTIPGLVRDKNDPDDVDTTGEDHAADCLRYGVMGRPTPTKLASSPMIILPDTPAALLASLHPQSLVRQPGMVS